MIKYNKLFALLALREKKKMDMVTELGIARPTLAKLSKGDIVTTETIDRICAWLEVQPGDIMEHVSSENGGVS